MKAAVLRPGADLISVRRLVPALLLALFAAFFFLPLLVFYLKVFLGSPPPELAVRVSGILASPSTWRIVGFTVGQAILSALISVVLSLPGAYLVARYRFPGKRLLYSLTLIPFILPSIIVVLCLISFYGRSGLLNRLLGGEVSLIYGPAGILLGHVFFNFSLAIRIIGQGWRGISPRYREISESLGEKVWSRFFRVTLPLLAPHAVTAFFLIFIYCFFSFGIILVFGGVRYTTLEVRIYTEMTSRLDPVSAALYSLIQLGLILLFLSAANRRILASQTEKEVAGEEGLKDLSAASPPARAGLILYGALVLVFLLGPLFTAVSRSFGPAGAFGFRHYHDLFQPDQAPIDVEGVLRSSVAGVITNSLALAASSGGLCFLAALAASLALRDRPAHNLEPVLLLPLGTSLVSLCFGLRLLYGGRLPDILLVIAAQVLSAFPFVFRMTRTVVAELQRPLLEAAESLGTKRWRILKDLELPLLRRGLLNALAYSLAIPFADLTAVLAIGRGEIATFPVAIYRLIGFRSFELALALGAIYMLICLSLFLCIDATSLAEPFKENP